MPNVLHLCNYCGVYAEHMLRDDPNPRCDNCDNVIDEPIKIELNDADYMKLRKINGD